RHGGEARRRRRSPAGSRPRRRSLAEDFLFLGRRRRVDLGERAVGQLLHLGFGALALVLADLVLLLVGLQRVIAVAAHVARGGAGFFGILAGKLGQLLAPFLGQVGDRQAQRLAVDGRVEAQARR